MKVILTVSDSKGKVVKQTVLEAGLAMVDALSEIQEGNFVGMKKMEDIQDTYPSGFVFDLRQSRIIN